MTFWNKRPTSKVSGDMPLQIAYSEGAVPNNAAQHLVRSLCRSASIRMYEAQRHGGRCPWLSASLRTNFNSNDPRTVLME